MLTNIFYEVDNFCKFFEEEMKYKSVPKLHKRNRKRALCSSEIIT
ncbi:IS982 family transposase, partial [Candidatus Dependentiae bacterium]|nr:IS982 family transposase [Candidatus Dependentiae bacterium]MBD3231514.1 IS982 family transposase [Candidatus Dependentiae bacterium]